MAIVNGYTTLAAVKDRMNITSVSATDDAVLESLVEQASRLIDIQTLRTFYARTETHTYDVPASNELVIEDDDLLTITTLTNGTGVVITAAQYKLYPLNGLPKYKIVILGSTSITWDAPTNGDIEGAISVAGTWGYSATTPKDVAGACEEIVVGAYNRRRGTNSENATVVTAAGIVITPRDIPETAWRVINYYMRRS